MYETNQEEIQWLKSRLAEKEEQVQRAAQAGLELLNQQMELQSRLDEQRAEMSDALEALEQDKYSLQKDVQLKTRMLESLQSDFDCVKNQQRRQLEELQENLERSRSTALAQVNNKLLKVQSALEESQLSEKQLRHKLQVQTETLNNKTEELQALSERTQSSMTSETMEVQLKIMELENVKVELEQNLQDCQYREQQLELSVSSLQRQLDRVTQEKEERQKEAVSWFNALEKSRELSRDLQVELDQALQQAQDPNSKGNSLFAELEDKRAAMEKQLAGVQAQYQSLQKQHSFSKQQLQRMKVQVATLMQLQGSRADPAQLERLQSMLSEKNGEIQSLMTKLQKLERVEMMLKSQPAKAPPTDGDDGQDGTYYTDLLKMKLSNSVKDTERLGDELSLQRMKSLSESQRALELERKLFTTQRLLKQVQSDKIKLQLRVEDLQHKYEPKEVKKNFPQKRKRERLPQDAENLQQNLQQNQPRVPAETAVDGVRETDVLKTDVLKTDVLETSVLETDVLKTDVLKTDVLETDADVRATGERRRDTQDPKPGRTVKISPDEPVVIPSPSCPVSGCGEAEENQQQNIRVDRRTKPRTVDVIHVSSSSSMENQCAQQ